MKLNLPLTARRIHLYLGLFFLPWFVMYGVTAVAFNHSEWFPKGQDEWDVEQRWPCTIPVDMSQKFTRELGAQLLEVAEMEPEDYGVYRWGTRPVVYVGFPSIWTGRRLAYDPAKQELALENQPKSTGQFLTSLHATGGYQHKGPHRDLWAVLVDLTCISLLFWVVSGLYLWWRFSRMRLWGGVALVVGGISFLGFVLLL